MTNPTLFPGGAVEAIAYEWDPAKFIPLAPKSIFYPDLIEALGYWNLPSVAAIRLKFDNGQTVIAKRKSKSNV